MKFEGKKIIEIDREAEEVAIPPTATRICEVACFFGSITSLDLENINVIIIEKHAFANCYKLQEVRLSSCLEEICEGAFKQCENLKHLSFPPDSRLRKIGKNSFKYCSKLEQFDFPCQIEFIGDYSFFDCRKLKKIDLRETKVRHIGHSSFQSSTNVYLPSTVSEDDVTNFSVEYHIEVDESHPVVRRDSCGYFFSNGTIFYGNKESRHVLIRRGVGRIANNCFYKSKLVSVTIPSSVTEISYYAFYKCKTLQRVCFKENSLLRVIRVLAFSYCSSIKKIRFPKSLKVINERAFSCCKSLERVVFPQDSQLERIEGAFGNTAIKRLSLPPSVREIVDVSDGMENLESMFVSNDYYQSNEEGSAIFSKDGSELVCVIKTLKQFKITDSVRVIKRRAFYFSRISGRLSIPPSVEVIEERAFQECNYLRMIEFKEGSRLKSLAFDAFYELRDLIINNENFIKMGNGVVMSMNPRGIVFVPRELTELEIHPGVEVIYSNAFYRSKIKSVKLPKSLKKICDHAFYSSSLESLIFEEGTELDFIEDLAFYELNIKSIKLPNIKGYLGESFLLIKAKVIEFPPNLCIKNEEICIRANNIICPRSSLPVIAHFNYIYSCPNLVILNNLPKDSNT